MLQYLYFTKHLNLSYHFNILKTYPLGRKKGMKTDMFRKGLVFAVIGLFFGLAFIPIITADIKNTSNSKSIQEITIEICDFTKRTKHKVNLPTPDVKRLDTLFDEIEMELDNATTHDKAITVINDVVIELNELGLLGDMTVEETCDLIMKRNQKLSILKILVHLQTEQSSQFNDELVNLFCFVYGEAIVTWAHNVFSAALWGLYISLIPFLGMGVIFLLLPIMAYSVFLGAKLFSFLNVILLYQPNLKSIGLFGFKNFIGPESEAIMYGFTGIKIGGFEKKNIIIGSTLAICSM